MKLAEKQCVPCKGGVQPYSQEEAETLIAEIDSDWTLIADSKKLQRVFKFKNFSGPMKLAMIIGDIAETEDHHPDLLISWGRLGVIVTTHAIKGLAESDFIFAAKVDSAFEQYSKLL